MWAAGWLLLLLGAAQLALAVDGSREAIRQRVCMVSEVSSVPDSGGRAWWWARFLLQELLDWATSLTASAAAIAACAVLLRRSDPLPEFRPRVLNFLAEALQGGKSWATFPQRFHFSILSTPPVPRPSRSVQTSSRPSLNETALLDDSASLQSEATLEDSVEQRQSLEGCVKETQSLEERASLQMKSSIEEGAPEVNLPEVTAHSSRISSEIGAPATQENLIRTSEAWLTLYREAPEGQQAPCQLPGPSEQLVTTLTKYLDAVVTELRLTNSRLACVLPSLEHSLQQPKESREQAEVRSRATSPLSSPAKSETEAVPEAVKVASTKSLSPSPSAPADRGDSEAGSVSLEVSEAQTSASWLQAQQQLEQERRLYERRVIALERRLREVLSELQLTRCQLADALTAQDFRDTQVPPLDVGSESSVSLVSSTMDAMLSTASVGSDSASEARSSASLSPKSTCTVVYRSKRRPDTHSSLSSTTAVPSSTFTSACTVVDTSDNAVKVLSQEKTSAVPQSSRSSPAVLTPSTSLEDVTDAEAHPEDRRKKAPQKEEETETSESSSESSFISSLSTSESEVSDRKRASTLTSRSWTEMSAGWLHAVQRLVHVLRTAPEQPKSSDETTAAPESAPPSSEEPSVSCEEHSESAMTVTEQQPATTALTEESSTEIKTSGRSLLSRMVYALLSSSSTSAASDLEKRTPVEAPKEESDAVVSCTAENEHIRDVDVTPDLAPDQTCSTPPTEESAPGGGLLSRVVSALLPASSRAAVATCQLRSSGEVSKAASDAVIATPAEVEHVDSKRSSNVVVSNVSCMDHQLSSVIILTPSPGTVEGGISQTPLADVEDRSHSLLSYGWSDATNEQLQNEQPSLEVMPIQVQAKSISEQIAESGSEQYGSQEKSITPGPDEQREMKAPVAKPSCKTVAEDSDVQHLLKMNEVHLQVTETKPQPILKDGDTQTDSKKEPIESPPMEKKVNAQQKDAGMQTRRTKRAVKPSLKESGVPPKQLQETSGKELERERGVQKSPPRKRPQKMQEKRDMHKPLKKKEEQEKLKDRKSKFQPKKDGVQAVSEEGSDVIALKQRQYRPVPKSNQRQAPSKEIKAQQLNKRAVQEPLEDSETQPATSSEKTTTLSTLNKDSETQPATSREKTTTLSTQNKDSETQSATSREKTTTLSTRTMTLQPMQKIEVEAIPEEEETEVLVENYDAQSVMNDREHIFPAEKPIQDSQQKPEPDSVVNDVETVRMESDRMLAESKSSCTQASMLWLRGLQRLTQQLKAVPTSSQVSVTSPRVEAVPSDQLTLVQEKAKQKISSLADVSVHSGSLMSCTVNTMLTASSSSTVSNFKKWKHVDSYSGGQDNLRSASTAAEGVDDTRPVVGGASGDSQLIRREEEPGETPQLASQFRYEEACYQTLETSATQDEAQTTSRQGEDETQNPEQLAQEKEIQASVKKDKPSAQSKRRRPGSPLKKGERETLPTDAITSILLKKGRASQQLRNVGTQTVQKKHVSRVLTKKKAVHKTIKERLDEEQEEQTDTELTEKKKENLPVQNNPEAEQVLDMASGKKIVETNRKSRFASWTRSLRWLSQPLRAASLKAKGNKQRTSSPLSSKSVVDGNNKPQHLSGDNTSQDSSKRKIPSAQDARSSGKSLISSLVNAMVSDSSVPSVSLPPTCYPKEFPSDMSDKNESTVFICTMVEGFDSGSVTAESVSGDSNTSLQKKAPGSPSSVVRESRLQPLPEGSGDQLVQEEGAQVEQRPPTPAKSETCSAHSGTKSSGVKTPTNRSSWTHTYASWLQNQQLLLHQLQQTRLEAELSEQQSPTNEEVLLSSVPLSRHSQHSGVTVPTLTGDQIEQVEASSSPSTASILKDWQPALEDLDEQVLVGEDAPAAQGLLSEPASDAPSYTNMHHESYGGEMLVAKRSSWTETYMSWLENQHLLTQQLQELRARNESRRHHSSKLQVPKTTALSASKTSLLSGVVSAMMAAVCSSGASASACSSISASAAADSATSATSTCIPSAATTPPCAEPTTYAHNGTDTSPSITLASFAYSTSAISGRSKAGTNAASSGATSPSLTIASSTTSGATAHSPSSSAASPDITYASSGSIATAAATYSRTGSCNTSIYAVSPNMTIASSNYSSVRSTYNTKTAYTPSSRAVPPTSKSPTSASKATTTSASSSKDYYASSRRAASPTIKFGQSSLNARTMSASSGKDSNAPSRRAAFPTKFGVSASNATATSDLSAKDTCKPHTRAASPTIKSIPSASNVTTLSAPSTKGSHFSSSRDASPTIKSGSSCSNPTTGYFPSAKATYIPSSRAASPTIKSASTSSNATTTNASRKKGSRAHSRRTASPTIKSFPSASNVTTISALSAKHPCGHISRPASPTIKSTPSASNVTTISDYTPEGSLLLSSRAVSPTIICAPSASNATDSSASNAEGSDLHRSRAMSPIIKHVSSNTTVGSGFNTKASPAKIYVPSASSETPAPGATHTCSTIARVIPPSITIRSFGFSVANSYSPVMYAVSPARGFGTSASRVATTRSPTGSTASPIVTFPSSLSYANTSCALNKAAASPTITVTNSASSEDITSVACVVPPIISFPSSSSSGSSTPAAAPSTVLDATITVKSVAMEHPESAMATPGPLAITYPMDLTTSHIASGDSPSTTENNEGSKPEEDGRLVPYTAPAAAGAAKETEAEAGPQPEAEGGWLVQAGRVLSSLPLPQGPGI